MDNKPELRLINMADVEATDVQWLWYPYIPYGKITIIQGDPGEGKTTLVLNLAAILSRGEKLPETDTALITRATDLVAAHYLTSSASSYLPASNPEPLQSVSLDRPGVLSAE